MKFTIVIPCKDEEAYVGRAISSVMMQGVDFEIFINDNSTDNTMKIVNAYKSFLGDKLIIYERHGEHIHTSARKILERATGDVFHCMSAHTHFMEGTLKYVEENIGNCLFGTVIHEDGTIQYPTDPENMSSYGMFLNVQFLRKNNLTYEEKYPDIGDYVLRKKIWALGAAELTDRILTMPSPRTKMFTSSNQNERNLQQQVLKQEMPKRVTTTHTKVEHGHYRPKYEK